jgi:glycogen synthase
VLVMPSVSEPFGLAAVEAIQAGVPVIMSKRSGLPEVVRNLSVVDPDDTRILAQACLHLIDQPRHAKAQSERAALEIRDLTWHRSATKLQALYDRLLDAKERSPSLLIGRNEEAFINHAARAASV